MRLLLTILLLFFVTSLNAQGQKMRAFVKSADDFEALNLVFIKNINTGSISKTDADGYFEINARVDDVIELSRVGIVKQTIRITAEMLNRMQQILLKYDIAELATVDINGQTQYQIDSTERYDRYKLTLDRQKDKAKIFISPIGIGVKKPFSSWMQYIVPKTKTKLRFQKNFAKWEEQKYIDQKYSIDKVQRLTGLQNDSLVWFMNTYPLPYHMARQSKDWEIDVWIKANYDDWQIKNKK